jgi:hypothetical protein
MDELSINIFLREKLNTRRRPAENRGKGRGIGREKIV